MSVSVLEDVFGQVLEDCRGAVVELALLPGLLVEVDLDGYDLDDYGLDDYDLDEDRVDGCHSDEDHLDGEDIAPDGEAAHPGPADADPAEENVPGHDSPDHDVHSEDALSDDALSDDAPSDDALGEGPRGVTGSSVHGSVGVLAGVWRDRSGLEAAAVSAAAGIVAECRARVLERRGWYGIELSGTQSLAWAREAKRAAVTEVQLVTGTGLGEATALVTLAMAPPAVGQAVAGALVRGETSWAQVRRFVDQAFSTTRKLTGDQQVLVATVLFGTEASLAAPERLDEDGSLPEGARWQQGRYEAALTREVTACEGSDVSAERARRAAAYRARRAWVRVHDDGTATLTVRGPAVPIVGAWARFDHVARNLRADGAENTLDQLVVDAMLAVLAHGRLDLPEAGALDELPPEALDDLIATVNGMPRIALRVIVPADVLGTGHPICASCTTTLNQPYQPHPDPDRDDNPPVGQPRDDSDSGGDGVGDGVGGGGGTGDGGDGCEDCDEHARFTTTPFGQPGDPPHWATPDPDPDTHDDNDSGEHDQPGDRGDDEHDVHDEPGDRGDDAHFDAHENAEHDRPDDGGDDCRPGEGDSDAGCRGPHDDADGQDSAHQGQPSSDPPDGPGMGRPGTDPPRDGPGDRPGDGDNPGDKPGDGDEDGPGPVWGYDPDLRHGRGQVGEVLGTHPFFLTPGQIRELFYTPGTTMHRILTDPADGRAIEETNHTYRPDPAMRRQVRAADVYSRDPWTRLTGRSLELDHVIPYNHTDPEAGGPTSELNLAALAKRTHTTKTLGLLTLHLNTRRDLTLTTLLGQITGSRVHDYRQYLTTIHPEDLDERRDLATQALYAALAARPENNRRPGKDTWLTIDHTDPDGQRHPGPPEHPHDLNTLLNIPDENDTKNHTDEDTDP